MTISPRFQRSAIIATCTLIAWQLAQEQSAKTAPYTVLGSLLGGALAEMVVPEGSAKRLKAK
jgi:hypothetical protein